jgi:hypothetical protein
MDEIEAERIKLQHTGELMKLEGVSGVGSLRKDAKGSPVLVLYLNDAADPTRLPKAVDGLAIAYVRTGAFKAESS